MREIVVIGGSAAGMMAAVAAARQDPGARVTLVTRDPLPYRRPAIPALIAGYMTGPEGARILTDRLLARYNIKAICPAQVTDIDVTAKRISVLAEGNAENLSYDAAVIAAGGRPLIAKIPGADKKGVCTFTTYEEAAQIVEAAKTARSAVVIGAGFIALEIAEALMHKGLDVHFNVRSRILRKLLEPELSEFLSRKFEQQGLKMLTGEAILEIGGADAVEYVLHKGERIPTDLVVMGTGVKPNVALAEKCGIELGSSGAIKVDNSLQTSVKGIYAAGDCAESPDLGTRTFVYMPVGSIGAAAGRIAGANAAGAQLETSGFLRAQADHILGFQIFSVGHSTTTAQHVDLKVRVHHLGVPESATQSGRKDLFETARILTDGKDRIAGAQLIAARHGSQFACQLYKAVLDMEKRKHFLGRFNSPRTKVCEALSHEARSEVVIKNIGEYKALALTENTGE